MAVYNSANSGAKVMDFFPLPLKMANSKQKKANKKLFQVFLGKRVKNQQKHTATLYGAVQII